MAALKKCLSHAWLWLPPLAVGVAAYCWTVAGEQPMTAGKAQGGDREGRAATAQRSDGRAVFEELHAAWGKEREEPETEEPAATGEELRARILELKRQAAASPKDESPLYAALDLVAELVRAEEGAGMRWLQENWPELCGRAMDSLAEADPVAAYEYLQGATRMYPCSSSTAMQVLAAHVKGAGEEDLLAAVRSMPWELFPDWENPPLLPPGMDAQLWVGSGAAHYLAEQGVEVQDVLPQLASIAPEMAVTAWLDWDRSNPVRRGPLLELARLAASNTDVRPGLLAAFTAAGPEALARVQAVAAGMPQGNDRDAVRALLSPESGDKEEPPGDGASVEDPEK